PRRGDRLSGAARARIPWTGHEFLAGCRRQAAPCLRAQRRRPRRAGSAGRELAPFRRWNESSVGSILMTSDRIDLYLDDMLDRLEGTPAERRRMLNEAEAHLRDSAAALEREG